MQGGSTEQDSTAAGEQDSLSPAKRKLFLLTAPGQSRARHRLTNGFTSATRSSSRYRY